MKKQIRHTCPVLKEELVFNAWATRNCPICNQVVNTSKIPKFNSDGMTETTVVDKTLQGKRIELISTNDPYTELKKGDMGTIDVVLKNNGDYLDDMIKVKWDNGSFLLLLEGIDTYKIHN